MIRWEATESGLRLRDESGRSVSVDAPGVEVVSAEPEDVNGNPPTPVRRTLQCVGERFGFDAEGVGVTRRTTPTDERRDLEDGPLDLSADDYAVEINAEIEIELAFTGAATVRRGASGDVVTEFGEPTAVTLVVGSPTVERVTVPATPDGIATALSYSHASHRTSGPQRSLPSMRGHPPLVELDDTVEVPEAVRESVHETGVELAVPPRVADLFVVAPLAHYLQARVYTADRDSPVLRIPDVDVERELAAMPDLERATSRTLRKTLFLDCLVRTIGTTDTDLAEASLLDVLDVDAVGLFEATPAERLATYLSVPYEAVERRLPDWHLSTYVDPVVDHVETLPYLLNDLSLVYTPRTSELDGPELVERSLSDFYRAGAGSVASVDIVKPELRSSRIHGWLADGVPIDVFKCTPAAYRNRHRYAATERKDGDGANSTEVVVVRNDEEMYDEHEDVERVYRSSDEALAPSVTVHERLSVAELARVFEDGADLVHYIGHCEEDGLRCPDGYMAAETLTACNARTFFLNACGSYHEGIELVERGAVAGAITFSQVLNDHAATVGSAFARLLAHGFSIERAMQLARRRIMMGKDYAVVGDGTHSLTRDDDHPPATVHLEKVGAGQFLLTYDQYHTGDTGNHYRPPIGDDNLAYLCGNESTFALDRDGVVSVLERLEVPVIYDGEFRWSGDLSHQLDG